MITRQITTKAGDDSRYTGTQGHVVFSGCGSVPLWTYDISIVFNRAPFLTTLSSCLYGFRRFDGAVLRRYLERFDLK